MLAIDMTPATVIIGLVVVALAVLAVRRLVRRGLCDCHNHDEKSGSCAGGCSGGCAGCAGCNSLDRMVGPASH